MALLDTHRARQPVDAHRPWPRAIVADDGWRHAIEQLAAGRCDAARPVGRRRRTCTWRCSTRRRRRRRASVYDCPDGSFPSRRRAPSAGDPARTRDPRSVRLEADRLAGRAALARSRLLGRAASARRPSAGAQARALRLPAGRRRGPAPDPGRAGACRHHRARTFPLHRQWRDSGAARAAARLRAQGHRGADGGRDARRGGASLPAAPPATARSPMRSPSRAPSRPRCRSTPPPRAHLSARADGRARAARQSFRRHRRDLQRRLVRAHARAMRHPARARAARGRRLLRPSADDGRDRARRRRARSRAGRRRRSCARWSTRSAERFPRAGRALRQHRLAAGPHRRHRHRHAGAGAPVRRRRLCRPRLGPRLRRAPRRSAIAPYDELDVRGAGARRGRRQCARLDPHPRGRAEPVADRADPRPRCRRARSASPIEPSEAVRRPRRWSKASAATCWSGCGSTATGASRAAICATRPGSSGRCWKPRSRATSSPTSRSATNRSTAPIRGTTSRRAMRKTAVRKPDRTARSPSRRPRRTMRRSPSLRRASTARRARGSAAPVDPRRSMPAPATAASWKSMRSTTPSTISNASACASSPRRATPTC